MKTTILLRNAAFLLAMAAATIARADNGAEHQIHQVRPIQLGTSGGNVNDRSTLYCCSGTLGALVQDEEGIQYILGNNHVLSRVNQGVIGEAITQPGAIDQECGTLYRVARLTSFIPIQFGNGPKAPPNEVDAAIARVEVGELPNGQSGPLVSTDGAILDIGTVSAETVPPTVGQSVQKSGRTTGHTLGSVSAVNATVNVNYSAECGGAATQKARFVNQIIITSASGAFSTGGDSGSVIFETGTTPRAVGLLFAGSSSSTIANPIDRVLSLLNVSMVGGPATPPTVGTVAGVVTDTANPANPISGATVAVDTGENTITASDGTYTIVDVPTGTRTVTAAAAGYVSQSSQGTVNEGEETTLDFALQAMPIGSQAFVQCVTYNTQGGKNKAKDLLITITVVDNSGLPVVGAQVDIAVTLDGSAFGTGTGAISSSSGEVTYQVRNASSSTYSTTVTSISKAGLTFDNTTPENSFTKGTTAVPANFCRNESTGAMPVSGAGHAKAAMDRARNVKARHDDALLEVEDVVGHGLSRNEKGEPVIEIYLAKENADARAKIPGSLENVPVRVVVTGPFTAY